MSWTKNDHIIILWHTHHRPCQATRPPGRPTGPPLAGHLVSGVIGRLRATSLGTAGRSGPGPLGSRPRSVATTWKARIRSGPRSGTVFFGSRLVLGCALLFRKPSEGQSQRHFYNTSTHIFESMVTNFLAANLDIIDRTWSLGEALRTIYARLGLIIWCCTAWMSTLINRPCLVGSPSNNPGGLDNILKSTSPY